MHCEDGQDIIGHLWGGQDTTRTVCLATPYHSHIVNIVSGMLEECSWFASALVTLDFWDDAVGFPRRLVLPAVDGRDPPGRDPWKR